MPQSDYIGLARKFRQGKEMTGDEQYDLLLLALENQNYRLVADLEATDKPEPVPYQPMLEGWSSSHDR